MDMVETCLPATEGHMQPCLHMFECGAYSTLCIIMSVCSLSRLNTSFAFSVVVYKSIHTFKFNSLMLKQVFSAGFNDKHYAG